MNGKNIIPNKIIILGKDGYNALGLLRQLNSVAHVIFLLNGSSKLCAVKSRYCKELHKVKNLEDGLAWLIDNFANEIHKPFLITTGDIEAEFVDQNSEKLRHFFYLTGTKEPGLLTKVLDKNYMNSIATRCGFLIPKSIKCQWDTDISQVKYPCLLKPDKNHRNHEKEFKTKRCDNVEELKNVLAGVEKESVFVLQNYIPKQYDALVYGCRTMSGQVIIPGALLKDRWDGGDGSHGFLTPDVPQSINMNAIKEFLNEINYSGLFSVEFGLLEDKAFFYEFNLRNDGTSNYFCQAGCNLPLIWIMDTLGMDYTNISQRLDGYHDFIAIADDFINVTSKKITFHQWRVDTKKATVFRLYDKKDNAPFFYNIFIIMLRPIRNFLLRLMKKR